MLFVIKYVHFHSNWINHWSGNKKKVTGPSGKYFVNVWVYSWMKVALQALAHGGFQRRTPVQLKLARALCYVHSSQSLVRYPRSNTQLSTLSLFPAVPVPGSPAGGVALVHRWAGRPGGPGRPKGWERGKRRFLKRHAQKITIQEGWGIGDYQKDAPKRDLWVINPSKKYFII